MVWPCGGCWTASKASGSKPWPTVDARGAAGAEHGVQAASTAPELRHRLRMGAGTAASLVRTALARLHRSPPPPSPWPTGTSPGPRPGAGHGHPDDLPAHTTADAEPVLVEAAGG